MARNKARIMFILGAVVTQPAFATPTSNTGGTPIANDTDSQAYPDTESGGRIWVLPPISGRAGEAVLSMETPPAECETMQNLVNTAKLYSQQILILTKQSTSLMEKYDQIEDKSSPEAIQLYTQSLTLSALIGTAMKTMEGMVAESAKFHGGTLTIPFEHEIGKNIADLKSKNPSYSDIRPVETYNARMYFSAPGSMQDGLNPALLPIINTYSVAGVKAADLANSAAQIAPRIDVTLSLTRMGACLMAFPQKFGVKTAPKLGMTAIYQYPFTFKSAVRASYNIKNIYSFLKQSGSSGGLFSSSSWTKTLDSNWGESAIKFLWSDSDPEAKVSLSERLEIERTVKAELLANMDKLIFAKTDLKASEAVNPGPHGATVLADGLDKTCAANAYCAAASIGLRTLDAIFGSSSMSTEVEKKIDTIVTYSLDANSTRYVSQGISYAGF